MADDDGVKGAGGAPDAEGVGDKTASGGAAWSPDSLPAEAQAWLKNELKRGTADVEAKARTNSKATAAKEARDALIAQLSEAIGLTDKPADADALAKELSKSKSEAKALRVERAIERTCGKLGADAELVEALLSKRGKLNDLDPAAEDFGELLGTAIAELIEKNPRLKNEARGGSPAAQGATATSGFSSGNGPAEVDVSTMDIDEMRKYLAEHRK